MEYQNWWLLVLPVFFLLGWLAARIDVKQLISETKQVPSNYIDGLNFLLNEEKDKAIEVLAELARVDPDSVELQFAIAGLFLQNGEIQRALTVHQALLDRHDLTLSQRNRAILAVGRDYYKSGMYDRAEQYLNRVGGKEYEAKALDILRHLFVSQDDWQSAIDVTIKYQTITGDTKTNEIGHFMVEICLNELKQGKRDSASQWIQKALREDPKLPRPYIVLGDIYKSVGDYEGALNEWAKLEDCAPTHLALVIESIVNCYEELERPEDCLKYLKSLVDVVSCEALFENLFNLTLELEGSDSAAKLSRKLLLETSDVLWSIRILDHMRQNISYEASENMKLISSVLNKTRPTPEYTCKNCGYHARAHYWHCPACQAWDTYSPIKQ